MTIEAILFDMDGVVIDTHKCAYAVLSDSAKEYGVDISPDEIMSLGSLSGRQFWQIIKEKYDVTESLESLVEKYDFEKEISYYHEIGLEPDLEDVLMNLKEKDYKLGLVTSAKPIRCDRVLSLFREPNLFDVVITADDVKEHKPSPDCYLKALKFLDLAPTTALVVEDSSNGAKAAKTAGCLVAAYKGSMWRFDSFDADYVIDGHKQIIDSILATYNKGVKTANC